jgi:hypothetical protein
LVSRDVLDMTNPTVVLYARIPADTKRAIDALAEELGVPMNTVVRELLTRGLWSRATATPPTVSQRLSEILDNDDVRRTSSGT